MSNLNKHLFYSNSNACKVIINNDLYAKLVSIMTPFYWICPFGFLNLRKPRKMQKYKDLKDLTIKNSLTKKRHNKLNALCKFYVKL